MYKGNKIAIGIPCFNEAIALPEVLEGISVFFPEAEVYVCDNNSSDNTFQVAQEYISSSTLSPSNLVSKKTGSLIPKLWEGYLK